MLRLPAFLARVASEYDALSHTPKAPKVQTAYAAFQAELDVQFATLCGLIDVRFTAVDPYPTSAAMFADVDSGRLQVYTHSELPAEHPMGETSPHGVTYNLVFRAVHDGLAHYPERLPFSYRGEFKAFKAHARLMPGNVAAIHALATETLGQNAWFNFSRRNLNNCRKQFAAQYAALLPWNSVRQALTEVSL